MIFLIDDNNTRVLFEKVLSSMPNEKARFVDDNNNLMIVFFSCRGHLLNEILFLCSVYIQAGKMPTFCAVLNIINFFFHFIEEIIFSSVMFGANFWNLKAHVVT